MDVEGSAFLPSLVSNTLLPVSHLRQGNTVTLANGDHLVDFLGSIRCPGLTAGPCRVEALVRDLKKGLGILSFQEGMPCFWVVFVGGTGTGKSTLFNALWGQALSASGVERPQTGGPVACMPFACAIGESLSFLGLDVLEIPETPSPPKPVSGQQGQLTVIRHRRDEWSHLVLVDTPDLDSLRQTHHQVARDFLLLADVLVFVTSQEKYADEAPYALSMEALQTRPLSYFVLNKAVEGFTSEEVRQALLRLGLPLGDQPIWLIPQIPGGSLSSLVDHPRFRAFYDDFRTRTGPQAMEDIRSRASAVLKSELLDHARHLLMLLEEEDREAGQWRARLQNRYDDLAKKFLSEERKRFSSQSKEYLGREIHRLFSRYDVLARPRRLVREVILSPFRLLGLVRTGMPDDQKGVLDRVRRKTDLGPLLDALETFQQGVLEELSPRNPEAPLFHALRQEERLVQPEEVRERIEKEQARLAQWLEERFQDLARELPRGKRWGIYSTSLLWGMLILSFEAAVGGGFTMLDAVLGSIIAPFLTKGAVELFAFQEVQKTARELAARYQEGVLSVLEDQRSRFENCLLSFLPPPETLGALRELASGLAEKTDLKGPTFLALKKEDKA